MTRMRAHIFVTLFTVFMASGLFGATKSSAQVPPSTRAEKQVAPLDIPQPDITGVDQQAQEQIRVAQSKLTAALAQTDTSPAHRAEAFGSLGQTYQAYGFNSAALACYANASRLDPHSFRWFYFASYLQQGADDPEAAERDYKHALTLRPNSTPALLRLGNLELTLDHPDAAKEYFTRAATLQPSSAAAQTGMGKVALLEHQYGVALKYFNQALAREPQASSIHYQISLAYRGLGDSLHMQEQLQARGDVEPVIHDPLLDEMDALKQGTVGLLDRGNLAMRENHFPEAAAAFRQMVQLNPSDPIGYKYLGVALAEEGKLDEALKVYEHSLQLDSNNATVQYNIGILLIETRREDQAVAHFQQALRLDPGLVAAHFQLANLFMRKARDADAEREYAIVVSLEPQNAFARFMQAMAAVHANSYAEARKLLENAAEALPADADIANALARLLATAPDPAVRDPNRALGIVQTLVDNQQGDALEVGITLAMALAAVGRFQEAATIQNALIRQLEDSRQDGPTKSLVRNLARYQQGKTCDMPWTSDDPIFTPTPSKAQLATDGKTASATP